MFRWGVWSPPQVVWDILLEFLEDVNPYYHCRMIDTILSTHVYAHVSTLKLMDQWKKDFIWKAFGNTHQVVIHRRRDKLHEELTDYFRQN